MLRSKTLTTYTEFHNVPEVDWCVYLINKLQRGVIAFPV